MDILNFISGKYIEFLKYIYSKNVKQDNKCLHSNSTTKTAMNGACTLRLVSKTEDNKKLINEKAKDTIKKYISSPELLLDEIEKNGVKVVKTAFTKNILDPINEQEGFIIAQQGLNALILNLLLGIFVEHKLSFGLSTEPMFIFSNKPVDIYILATQLHKWYGVKYKLPGFDFKTQKKLKKINKYSNNFNAAYDNCTINELLSLKEAIARDIEAIDFAVNLSKEYKAAKHAYETLKTKGANI